MFKHNIEFFHPAKCEDQYHSRDFVAFKSDRFIGCLAVLGIMLVMGLAFSCVFNLYDPMPYSLFWCMGLTPLAWWVLPMMQKTHRLYGLGEQERAILSLIDKLPSETQARFAGIEKDFKHLDYDELYRIKHNLCQLVATEEERVRLENKNPMVAKMILENIAEANQDSVTRVVSYREQMKELENMR